MKTPDSPTAEQARRVAYLPPEREQIEHYVKQVCDQLAERYGDTSYKEGEVVYGLSEFLQLAGRIQAKHFNMRGTIDKSAGEG